jgi:hypothetical protein
MTDYAQTTSKLIAIIALLQECIVAPTENQDLLAGHITMAQEHVRGAMKEALQLLRNEPQVQLGLGSAAHFPSGQF